MITISLEFGGFIKDKRHPGSKIFVSEGTDQLVEKNFRTVVIYNPAFMFLILSWSYYICFGIGKSRY